LRRSCVLEMLWSCKCGLPLRPGATGALKSSGHIYRAALARRLFKNAHEIQDAILDRIGVLEGSLPPLVRFNLESLVAPLLTCAIESIEGGKVAASLPPVEAIAHAREAAHLGVSTRTLQDRYLAGYTVFKRFLRREHIHMEPQSLIAADDVHGLTDLLFERLIREVGDEHERELVKAGRSADAARLERVKDLLSGNVLEVPELPYRFDATHVGIVGDGPKAASAIRTFSHLAGGDLLLVHPKPHFVWAWVGTHSEPSCCELSDHLKAAGYPGLRIAVGEPMAGIDGWRITHKQALAAVPLAARSADGLAQFSCVALLASTLNDEVLTRSLARRYLNPLAADQDGGAVLRETLQAYFSTGGNVSSAAAKLGVRRHTVTNRLRAAEKRFGNQLHRCRPEVELALRIEAMRDESSTTKPASPTMR
jgi:hypothetical protein